MKTSTLILLGVAGVGGFYLYRSMQASKQLPASTGASSGPQGTVASLWSTLLKGVSNVVNQYTTAGGDGSVDYSGGVSHGADGSMTATPVATADGNAAIADAFDLQRYAGIGQTPETLTTREQAAIGGTLTNSYYATA